MPNVYVDIETIPGANYPSFDEIEPPKNYRDSQKIEKYKEQKQKELYRAQALDSMKGRILCIGYAIEDEPVQVIYNEDITDSFFLLDEVTYIICNIVPARLKSLFRAKSPGNITDVLKDMITWVGHNIRNFDLQWLYRHAIRERLEILAATIPRERYAKNVIDTMELWAGPDFRNYTKLEDIAQFLRIGKKKDDIHGSEVYDYWLAGNHIEIQEYCKQDVELVRQIYKQINFES